METMGKKRNTTNSKDSKKTSGGIEGGVELDFGGLFRGLGDVVDLVGKLAEAGEQQVERHGEFRVKGLGDQARGVYGFSIRSGIGDAEPRVEPFGNVHADQEGLVVDDVREPLVDLFDEGKKIVVTAELPGVQEKEIALRFEGDVVTIETLGERRYAKEVLLPAPVAPETQRLSYNNGVLEIRIDKQS